MSPLRRGALVASVGLLLACSGTTGPVAGTLKVNLSSPNNGLDGAVLLVLSAPTAPVSVSAGSGLTLWGGPVTTANASLVLTGNVTTGTILTLQVDDINRVRQYSVTLQQVAQTSGYQLESLAGYSVTVTK
ncbi:MAG TPA: hypothetical protein VKB45_06115 [Gemmatimonadales bacterium]|nr:hypothetical protein [Gemmatimonadales bacterium]